MELTPEQKKRILWVRQLLKEKAPSVYQDFGLLMKKKYSVEVQTTEISVPSNHIPEVKKMVEEDDFIKGLEQDKLNYE